MLLQVSHVHVLLSKQLLQLSFMLLSPDLCSEFMKITIFSLYNVRKIILKDELIQQTDDMSLLLSALSSESLEDSPQSVAVCACAGPVWV